MPRDLVTSLCNNGEIQCLLAIKGLASLLLWAVSIMVSPMEGFTLLKSLMLQRQWSDIQELLE